MMELEDFNIEQSVIKTLDIQITEYTKERVTATMPVTPKTHQPMGLLHGGVSVVVAETVASAGSYLFINPDTHYAVGMEINANHIRSVSSGTITAVGVPLHIGRSSIIWDIKIHDDQDRLICVSRCTMAVVALPPK